MNRQLALRLAAAGAAVAVVGGGAVVLTEEDSPDPPASTATVTPSVEGPDEPTVLATKIVVIVNENRGYNQVRKGAPWMKSMGDKFGQATNVYAWGHPSQPNYLVMLWGTNRGITSNNTARIAGQSLQGKIPAGEFWTFAQSMSTDNCRLTQRGYYHPRHVPTTTAKDERALCEKYTVGYDKIKAKITAGTLPKVSFIVPNNCSNSHDCSLGTADRWNKTEVERLMAGPDYQSGKLVIVGTWDEDNKTEGNHIHTYVVHPSLENKVVTTRLSLYSIHKTMAEFGGVAPIGTKAAAATSLATAFGLPVA